MTLKAAFLQNFLGNCSTWYKGSIIFFLVINPFILFIFGPVVTSWLLVGEFIFTLAMALKCYPLIPGGLLVIEALILGLSSPETLYKELIANFPVLLLLIFMVAGIYFLKELLLFLFTYILLKIHHKIFLSLLFTIVSALLSAFLDALTVTAVIISVGTGFYTVYHKVASGKKIHHISHNHHCDAHIVELYREDLDQFREFLRSLLMHAAVGTALGGVCTLVGEPQNLIIAERANWNFIEFFLQMAPITMPTLVAGVITCILLEKLKWFGYGTTLPLPVREVLQEHAMYENSKRTPKDTANLIVQAIVALILVVALALHIAEIGLVGLLVIILTTAFTGITEEHQLGRAFEEALPFTALLAVFFGIVGVIHEQHLFAPVINSVLTLPAEQQPKIFFLVNGLLSAISDNVFVATIYIDEVKRALTSGLISEEQFELLAIAINTGTNLPSIATPNGQAAFLFLLTSTLAPLIRLSYGRMVWMALPYTIVLTIVGYIAVAAL